MQALQNALSSLLDSRVLASPIDEMYAVFEEESTVCAFGVLAVGFSRYARPSLLSAKETQDRIILSLEGERRMAEVPFSLRDLLPQKKQHRTALALLLRKNDITYTLAVEERVTLTFSIPRFLADRYGVASAVDREKALNRFYDAMVYLAGETPSEPLPLSPLA